MLAGELRTPKRRSLKHEKREATIKKKEEEENGCIIQLELSTAGSITHDNVLAADRREKYGFFVARIRLNQQTVTGSIVVIL